MYRLKRQREDIDMQFVKAVTCALTILTISCSGAYAECRTTGFSVEPVCDVSLHKLISDPKFYEGKLIELRGYYSAHSVAGVSKRLLFISKEAEFSADYGASVELGQISEEVPDERALIYDQILNHPNLPLRIIGRLKLEPNRFSSGRAAMALIDPIVGVSHIVPPPRELQKN